jgi:type I restriction-modification system DNA methylase subunit
MVSNGKEQRTDRVEESETVTENIFRDFYGVKTFIEKSAIPKDYRFKSKKGTTYAGYPDFLKADKDFLIVVECKASTKSHQQAEDEVKHYISNVSGQHNVIGIAISGQGEEELQVTHFLSVTSSRVPEDINIKKLLPLNELIPLCLEKSIKINYETLVSYADKMNTTLHERFKIPVPKRPFFFAALLFAFDDLNAFLLSHKSQCFEVYNEQSKKEEVIDFQSNECNDKAKVDFINNLISDGVAKKFVGKLNNRFKTIDVPAKFQFIKTDNRNISSDEYIKFLENFVRVFREYKQTVKYYDIIGTFYSEFLRYVQKAGGQDIVLTPDHIKTFMCDLLDLQLDSVVLDICAGSGGFPAVAFGAIDKAMKNAGKHSRADLNHIREKQIIGVEIDEDMFALAFSNMILHGDGKSNLYKGNCFENFEVEEGEYADGEEGSEPKYFEDKIKELRPDKALMNPPYNDDAAPGFILRLVTLLKMAGNGTRTACVIAPSGCLRKKPEVTKEIFRVARLKTVIDMNVDLFCNQKIAAKTSIFIFEVGSAHSGKTYFYDFKIDGYYYSERKTENRGDFESIKSTALSRIKDSILIDGVSYQEVINENNLDNTMFQVKTDTKLKNIDFIRTILDYSLFELGEKINGK